MGPRRVISASEASESWRESAALSVSEPSARGSKSATPASTTTSSAVTAITFFMSSASSTLPLGTSMCASTRSLRTNQCLPSKVEEYIRWKTAET